MFTRWVDLISFVQSGRECNAITSPPKEECIPASNPKMEWSKINYVGGGRGEIRLQEAVRLDFCLFTRNNVAFLYLKSYQVTLMQSTNPEQWSDWTSSFDHTKATSSFVHMVP